MSEEKKRKWEKRDKQMEVLRETPAAVDKPVPPYSQQCVVLWTVRTTKVTKCACLGLLLFCLATYITLYFCNSKKQNKTKNVVLNWNNKTACMRLDLRGGGDAHLSICTPLADLPSFSSHPSLSGLKNVCVRSLPSSSGILKGSFLMLSYKFCMKIRHKEDQLHTCGLRPRSFFLFLIIVTLWGSPWAAPLAGHHLHWCHGS